MSMRAITTTVLALALLTAGCGGGVSDDTSATTEPVVTAPSNGGGMVTDEPAQVPSGWDRVVPTIEGITIQVHEGDRGIGINGQLPTPCHQLSWTVTDDGETVSVELFAAVDPEVICAQVLQPFDVTIGLPDGSREVTLNGEKVGEY